MRTVRHVRGIEQAGNEPTPLHAHALEQLSFIRSTLESSGTFTAVPGKGFIGMGLVALTAAAIVATPAYGERWLTVWLVAGVISFLLGGWLLSL